MNATVGAILCYHSITSAEWPASASMHVPVDELIGTIEFVRRLARIVPLSELLERHRAGKSTQGLMALTFDDGYAALPALIGSYVSRAHVPISVFITTRASDRAARFWWDRIDDCFPRIRPERWRAFEDVVGIPDAYRVGQPAEYGPLRPLRQWIMANYQGRWPAHLEEALTELENGATTAQRAMSWDEIATFSASGLVEYGAHTLTHPVLPLLSDTEFAAEVGGAYRELKAHVPNALPVLAIPFGLYDSRTIRLARDAGMRTSLTLDNRTLRGIQAEDAPPRLSISRGLKKWKFFLRLTIPRQPPTGYPALPSATT